jgi:hypothetical protein
MGCGRVAKFQHRLTAPTVAGFSLLGRHRLGSR